MSLFNERNVHSRYKAARARPRTELKKRGEEEEEEEERKVKKFRSAIARIVDNIFFAESPCTA